MDKQAHSAVLFADVSGSTRLYETAGDALAMAGIGSCLALLGKIAEANHGRVIKTIGDEILAMFPSASAAADAAMAMQEGVAGLPPVGGTRIGIRIGFHFGPVTEREGDVFGDSVNVASRLANLAARDQIITSEQSVQALEPRLIEVCRPLYSAQVKGKEAEVKLWELLWRQSDEGLTIAASRSLYNPTLTVLRLTYRDLELQLSADRNSVLVGRDASADFVIEDRKASRAHARILRRLEKFVLVDSSANGTFVKIEGEPELVLRRENFVLHGRGVIAFGQSCSRTEELVEFQCD